MSDLASVARSLLLDADPTIDFPAYQRLLTESAVLRTGGCWVVCGHAEVSRLAADPRLTIDPRAGDPPLPLTQSERLENLFGQMLNFRDGEAHTRLRRLVAAAFSARRVNQMSSTVRQVVDDLLDDLLTRDGFDAVADLGVPLPVMTSCALLELPRERWSEVAGWADRMSGQLFRFGQTPAELAEVEGQLDALTAYVHDLADERRGRPGDLIGDLLGSDRLDADEFVAFVVLLFMNGLETVTAAVSSCVAELLWRPGLAQLMRERPERADAVFEELTRLHTPARMGARRATAAIDLGDVRIEAGDPVFLMWAAANRDPRVFADPDEFRPGRSGRSVTFGQGPHHCLGAALAGVQGAAVLRQLAARADLSGDSTAARRRRGPAIHGYAYLPVQAHPLDVQRVRREGVRGELTEVFR